MEVEEEKAVELPPLQAPPAAVEEAAAPSAPVAARVEVRDEKDLFTLDEPVWQTMWRDVKRIGLTLYHVMVPTGEKVNTARDWDLWGPLLICLFLAGTLSLTAPEKQASLVFSLVFVVVWLGAGIVTFNAAVLGGKISFCESVCVLGYCVFPLALARLLMLITGLAVSWTWPRFFIAIPCLIWSTWASVGFMSALVPADRKALSIYPICLFFAFITWMVLVQPNH
eukprot:TRINITY_DN18378_c0_g1_i1.p1 TRINITY_DN18378_c0_g1~~TRINITY_DN18378_c0_g1_i1.p1  ORF type:complete len:225 (-),score=71.45 TRINITY_DN18378_c0_g1_i1:98-772(-)